MHCKNSHKQLKLEINTGIKMITKIKQSMNSECIFPTSGIYIKVYTPQVWPEQAVGE